MRTNIIAAFTIAFVSLGSHNSGCGSSSSHSNLPQCESLTMDTTSFTFTNVSLQYDLLRYGATPSDRIELAIAHSEFNEMRGEITWLQNIMFFSDNYSQENKPSISADFSFDNCSGTVHKDFSKEEIIGNTIFNIPYQPFRLTDMEVTVRTIRTTSGFQYVWPGKAFIDNTNLSGSLETEGTTRSWLNMQGYANTTTGVGGFAGLLLDQYDELIAYENTIDSTFVDSNVIISLGEEDFNFSSTLSKSVYIHGLYDSSVRWLRPTIFVIEEPDLEGDEPDPDPDGGEE